MLLTYKTPLAISILLIVLGSFVLCWILYKYTFVDKLTALFSCMPGGASVMISLSEDYGADSRIVTAFHTVRMTVFVICIPLLAGLITNAQGTMQVDENSQAISTMLTLKLLILASIVIGSIYVAKVIKIPSAPFTLSMIFGFIFNQFIFPLGEMPAFTVSIPLVLLGGLIGLRFSRDLLKRLSAIKKYVLLIIFLYTLLGSGVAFLVYEVTSLNFTTSLLSIIPGGAAEMASTAALLGQDASFVASFQLIRLLILSLFFPIIAHFMFRKNLEGTNLDSAKRS